MNTFLTQNPKVVLLVDEKSGVVVLAKTNISNDLNVVICYDDKSYQEAILGLVMYPHIC